MLNPRLTIVVNNASRTGKRASVAGRKESEVEAMKLYVHALLSTCAITGWTGSNALAADYDPPIYVEEAPEFVPVEVGSGWYLRGDLGYNFGKPFRKLSYGGPTIANPAYDESHTAISGSVGFGYHWSDYFRTDVNFGFLSKNDQNLSYREPGVSATAVSIDNQAWTGMANAYVDLGTYVGITPYLGAGLGFVYSERGQAFSRNFVDPAILDINTTASENQFSLAYTLNAGAAYRLTNNLSLDVGYQYFSAPNLEYSEISAGMPVISEGVNIHQVKVGLRYDIW